MVKNACENILEKSSSLYSMLSSRIVTFAKTNTHLI